MVIVSVGHFASLSVPCMLRRHCLMLRNIMHSYPNTFENYVDNININVLHNS